MQLNTRYFTNYDLQNHRSESLIAKFAFNTIYTWCQVMRKANSAETGSANLLI